MLRRDCGHRPIKRPSGSGRDDRCGSTASRCCRGVGSLSDDAAEHRRVFLLVTVVVAVAANGQRVAGLLAAVSAAAWFDFFLTQPYERFAITHREDIETTVLLVAVGAAVTKLAGRGRRHKSVVRTKAQPDSYQMPVLTQRALDPSRAAFLGSGRRFDAQEVRGA